MRGLPTARRSKKFGQRRGVRPQASVPPPSVPPPSTPAPSAPPPSLPLPPPGMQIVPVSIPRPSIGKLTSTAGMPGGPSAALKCGKSPPRHGAGANGPPMSIRAQIIRSETHVRDGNYGGWIFDPTTSSHTITLQSHTMDELHMRCQPLIPYELVEVRRIAHLYVLFPGPTAEWRVLQRDAGNNFWLGVYLAALGKGMLDIQVELAPSCLALSTQSLMRANNRVFFLFIYLFIFSFLFFIFIFFLFFCYVLTENDNPIFYYFFLNF